MKHNSTFYATQLKWGIKLFNFFQRKGNGQAKEISPFNWYLFGLWCSCLVFTMTLNTNSSLKTIAEAGMGCVSHQHGHLWTEDAVAWSMQFPFSEDHLG